MSLSTIRKMTLRLNMEEPKQVEIYQILTSLDKDKKRVAWGTAGRGEE